LPFEVIKPLSVKGCMNKTVAVIFKSSENVPGQEEQGQNQ
jgi:hypothetical protein